MLADNPIDVMILATDLGVARSASGTSDTQTKASWRVSDLAAEVADLRARGVQLEEYDEPGLTTVEGIADVGFALASWFVDPHGNSIGLLQFKDAEAG